MLILATAAAAQPIAPQPDRQPRAEQPRMPVWRAPAGPLREGRLGLPVAGNLQLGVGRFSVQELARLRTHTEPISRSMTVPRRNLGIAAIGLSLRF